MKTDRHSRTAERAAGLRALHSLYDPEPIFRDPQAARLTDGTWRLILRWGWLARAIASPKVEVLCANRGQVVSRSRYAEDALGEALAAGVRQYVIIGAGMDSYALRAEGAPKDLTVYEVDHPASQAHKQARLRRTGLAPGLALHPVPVDFEREGLFDGLSRSPFDAARPAFFSWLGVSYYLRRESIAGLLRAIAAQAAAGSELVFDYAVPEEAREGRDLKVWTILKRGAERHGEPLLSSFAEAEIETLVAESGLELVEHLPAAEIQRRWFAGRSDGLWALATGLVRCRVP